MSNRSALKPEKKVIGSTTLGRKRALNETHTLRFEIEDFQSIPCGRSDYVVTPCLDYHGYRWRLRVFPGRARDEDLNADDDEYQKFVYILLEMFDAVSPVDRGSLLHTKCTIRLADGAFVYRENHQDFAVLGSHGIRVPRTPLLNSCVVGGSLVVEVDITVLDEIKQQIWSPKIGPKEDDLLNLMKSNDEADGHFCVGNDTFPAYRCLLKVRAPTLHELFQGTPNGSEVKISDVTSSTFQCLLRFVYGRELPKRELIERNGRDLLKVADRFGCKQLKLYVETEIAKCLVKSNNAAEWFVFADSHSCALLKETAMNVFASDATTVMASAGWEAVKESKELLLELMDALAHCGRKRYTWRHDDDYDNMDVSNLRQTLKERGHDDDALDGTREMLVKRLKS